MRRGRLGQRSVGVAALQRQRIGDELASGSLGFCDGGDMRQVFIFNLGHACGLACGGARFGDDCKCGLPVKLDKTFGQHRFVMLVCRADVVAGRHVFGRQHRNDAGIGCSLLTDPSR